MTSADPNDFDWDSFWDNNQDDENFEYDRIVLLQRIGQSFYHWHCGIAKHSKIIGKWAHDICHQQDKHAPFHPETGETGNKDVSGGWHDAGDYNKYVCPTAVTIWWLMTTIKIKPEITGFNFGMEKVYSKKQLIGIIKTGLDWLLKMQRADGAFYHKVSEKTWSGHIRADEDQHIRYIMPVSYESTAKAAAILFKAASFFDDETYLKSAQKAIKLLLNSPDIFPAGFENPKGVVTGAYSDFWQEDNLYWALTEQYLYTNDDNHKQLLLSQFKKIDNIYYFDSHPKNWIGNFQLGAISLILELPDFEMSIELKNIFIGHIDFFLEKQKKSPYKMYVGEKFNWGSNGTIAAIGNQFYLAYYLTKKTDYKMAAENQLNYLLGFNPLEFSFVTGFGKHHPENPHYRPSTHEPDAPAGFLVGGANEGFDANDFVLAQAKNKYPDEPAKQYTDEMVYGYASWASNEVAIYWNAPLLALVAFLL